MGVKLGDVTQRHYICYDLICCKNRPITLW